jgi:Ser/Thr protein kinase RdoA (MazF antagonist)
MEQEIILKAYGISPELHTVANFGNGLINNTWLVKNNNTHQTYILQRINSNVFKHPEDIAFNIRLIDNHLKQTHLDYLFEAPLNTAAGEDLLKNERGYFRLFNFVKKSHTVDVLQNAEQAYEAAMQFGRFTSFLNDMDATQLKTTIPDFHNLLLRFQQFQDAIKIEDNPRKEKAAESIRYLLMNEGIVNTFVKIKYSDIKKRVIHHDTKISNVLFDDENKGLCVIDLDTVMPGYFISDVGDMMRTYLSPVTEEEGDITKINIRDDFFDAILKGYLKEMKNILEGDEIKYFVYAGKFMIYMQALRFLTDYLNNDIYYGAKYEGHNFVRALNQIQLLKLYTEKEELFEAKVKKYL